MQLALKSGAKYHPTVSPTVAGERVHARSRPHCRIYNETLCNLTADTTPGPKRCQGGCVSSSRHLAELMIIMIRDDTLKLSSRVASMAS